ncbi:helix-turn-helix domain-containing protein [Cytobacillus horneckiae]|uniref:helix-turn-helix domain-containing protein n=1 Tax=Cytobacillus horneckiae TaxID=549687 RepID=UPI003D9A1CB8
MISLGDQIRKLRKENRLTQKQLADKLQVDQSSISYYEQNKKLPDIYTLQKLASIFDVTIDTLVQARNYSAHAFNPEQAQVVREVESDIKITPEDLKKKFSLVVDGRPATDQEIEDAIRYIAFQRQLNDQKD